MKEIDTLKHIIYINTYRYSWKRKDMITIVLELYMSKRNWKNIELISCCQRSEPIFFFFGGGGELALVPLNLLYPFKLSVQNTQNKKSRTTN